MLKLVNGDGETSPETLEFIKQITSGKGIPDGPVTISKDAEKLWMGIFYAFSKETSNRVTKLIANYIKSKIEKDAEI